MDKIGLCFGEHRGRRHTCPGMFLFDAFETCLLVPQLSLPHHCSSIPFSFRSCLGSTNRLSPLFLALSFRYLYAHGLARLFSDTLTCLFAFSPILRARADGDRVLWHQQEQGGERQAACSGYVEMRPEFARFVALRISYARVRAPCWPTK